MPKCDHCQKNFMMGGKKEGEERFCSANCRSAQFADRFFNALNVKLATQPPPPPPPPAPVPSGPDLIEGEEGLIQDSGKDALIVGVGVAVAFLLALGVYFLVDLIGYPLHQQTFLFVIPIGGYLSGMLFGIGFWFMLRRLERLPSTLVSIVSLIAGALAYLLIFVAMWWFLEFEGGRARDQVGFGEFFQFVISHQRIRVGRVGDGFEVGMWGYVRFALSIVAAAFGAFSTVAIAGGRRYCPTCRRYYRPLGTQSRTLSDPQAAADAWHPVINHLVASSLQQAIDQHAASAPPKAKGTCTTNLAVEHCPGCGLHLATLTGHLLSDQGVQAIEGFTFAGTCREPVHLPT